MPRDSRRSYLVIALLSVAVIGTLFVGQRERLGVSQASGYEFVSDIDNWQRTDRERAVTSPYDFSLKSNLAAVPMTLGKWVGQDVPQTNLEVFILLEPEQYVQRVYQLPDGRYVWLSLIGSHKSKSFHSPQICYDTDGWRTDASSEAVPLASGEIHALRLTAIKSFGPGSDAEHVVLYFYLWPTYARNSQDGTVLVKVTALKYKSVEETLALEKEFLQQMFVSSRS